MGRLAAAVQQLDARRIEMNRIGSASIELQLTSACALTVRPPLEVSLDCKVCRRHARTIQFYGVGSLGVCTPTGHEFGGALLELGVTPRGALARFAYRHEPFIDAEFPRGHWSIEPGAPTWVRFNLIVSCGTCGASTKASTQSNLVRPWTCQCACGARLYEDQEEPRLAWEEKAWP